MSLGDTVLYARSRTLRDCLVAHMSGLDRDRTYDVIGRKLVMYVGKHS
jgi:hypothetical protein